MQRNATRKTKKGGGNNPSCGCDMQVGWPKFLTENIPLPTMKGGACAACSGLPLPTPMSGGGQPTAYNSNPIPDACPFPGTGYCGFYARGGFLPNHNTRGGFLPNHTGGANYGEPMNLQARLRGGANNNNNNEENLWYNQQNMGEYRQQMINRLENAYYANSNNNNNQNTNKDPNAVMPLSRNNQEGGGCGCVGFKGGYRPTKKNLKALKKWRRGQSIGFTKTSSLKAKGLIPRNSKKHRGKKVVSAKYQ